MQRHLWGFLALCLAALPSSAAITGVVMTTDGQPVAGARVSIRAHETTEAARARLLSASPEAVPISSMQTDSKGTFSLESPKDPVVYLLIYARGYEPQQRLIERDEEVGAIALQKSEMRKGSVKAGGKPVAGANVILYYLGYEYLTKTDEKGSYEAPDPKRSRSIAVLHPDYALNDETFMTMTGVNASVLQRTVVAGSAFQGRVVSGEQDTPVAKATILVDGWPLATTGDDGTFTIAHMNPKWKTITARKDSLLGQRTNAKDATAPIRIAKAATISGRITDAKTRVPVAGAIVRAGPRRFGPGMDAGVTALTDAKGAYSLMVPAGTYMVMASHPGYAATPADASAVAGQQTSKDVALSPMARVSGVVVDESKRPVVVAVLDTDDAQAAGMGMPRRMMSMRGSDAVVSGPDGRFSMRIEPDEALWVRATKRGFPPAKSESLQLTAGERKSGLVLTIPSGIAVSGRAIDPQGDPLSGVSVTASEAEGGPRGMMMRMFVGGLLTEDDAVRTASDGTFTMRVKEGTYDFTFRREGLAPKTVRGQSITVTSSPAVEATLEPAADISGRVTRGGVGLENVMIMAMVPGGGSNTTTGPDGSFTLSGLAPGSVRIMARKEEDFVQETRNVTAPARDVVIDLKSGGRITGRVVDKGSGKPITTFQAGLTTSRAGGGMVMMGPPQLRSFTSDDGSFTLDSVPAGATVLMASAPGYASARLNVTVEDDKELTGVELQLDTGVKLIGRVTGPNGSAISDVQVRVLPSPTGGFATSGTERTSTTDANGEYSIDGLEAGEESLNFTHQKYSSIRKSVTLKGRETRLDVQLASGGRVTGTVVTEAGAPVSDAQVEAYSSGGFESARTDANGAFEFDSVTPGRYRFSANKTGFAEGMIEDVDVSSGAPVRIVLKTGGTIYGRITGLTAQELAQAEVSANNEMMFKEGSVDGSGNYRIEGVTAGTVSVLASSGSGMTGSSRRAATQTVELAAGGSQQVDITFRDDVVISGRVTRNGEPLSSASVNFFPRGNFSRASASAATDNDGHYSARGLDEGEYTVMVNDSQRMSPYSATYQVRGSATYDIDYKTSALRGRVLDAGTNEPLANVTVQLRNNSQNEGPRMTRGGLSDATGAFILDSVPPGNYTVTATREGYGNDVKELYVGESAPQDLELHLARNSGVTLNVVDARDNQPISARASVYDMQGRVVDETRMMFGSGGETGSLKLSVSPGNYTATVSASGYAPRNVSFLSPSTQTVALSPGGTLQVRSRHSGPVRIRLIDANGIPYWRFSNILASRELLPSPNTTTFPNVAAGAYTMQLLENEVVVESKRVVVQEGQTTTEEI
jgi:Carboxypeptidase regulatory-like domain